MMKYYRDHNAYIYAFLECHTIKEKEKNKLEIISIFHFFVHFLISTYVDITQDILVNLIEVIVDIQQSSQN